MEITWSGPGSVHLLRAVNIEIFPMCCRNRLKLMYNCIIPSAHTGHWSQATPRSQCSKQPRPVVGARDQLLGGHCHVLSRIVTLSSLDTATSIFATICTILCTRRLVLAAPCAGFSSSASHSYSGHQSSRAALCQPALTLIDSHRFFVTCV